MKDIFTGRGLNDGLTSGGLRRASTVLRISASLLVGFGGVYTNNAVSNALTKNPSFNREREEEISSQDAQLGVPIAEHLRMLEDMMGLPMDGRDKSFVDYMGSQGYKIKIGTWKGKKESGVVGPEGTFIANTYPADARFFGQKVELVNGTTVFEWDLEVHLENKSLSVSQEWGSVPNFVELPGFAPRADEINPLIVFQNGQYFMFSPRFLLINDGEVRVHRLNDLLRR